MKNIRKTKIVCTLGPSSTSPEILRELMIEGMDVARFNFSHGSYEEKLKTLDQVKKIREELGLYVATLLDTKGPEIRIGNFEDGQVQLKEGQTFTLTINEIQGTDEVVSINYKALINDVNAGDKILIDDGLIEMEVTDITDTDIRCRVINGGVISDKKGVNVPDARLSMPFISEQDYKDIVFGIKNGFDFIAASFVRTAEDILEIRKILKEYNCNEVKIIAKIENKQGLNNLDDIINVSDGIMVARGDLGVEVPFEEVPAIQKLIIKKVYRQGKPVITATQMLDSMIKNPRPTRAEATDVANAIYDGTSAIMLSGETAAGLYPVESLKTMVKIALSTEQNINYIERFKQAPLPVSIDITNAISHATCTTAIDLNAAAIITVTKSGSTARAISKHRPVSPIVGCSPDEYVCRQLNLSWGVIPIHVEEKKEAEELFERAIQVAVDHEIISTGELVVLTAGIPLGVTGTTNSLRVVVAE